MEIVQDPQEDHIDIIQDQDHQEEEDRDHQEDHIGIIQDQDHQEDLDHQDDQDLLEDQGLLLEDQDPLEDQDLLITNLHIMSWTNEILNFFFMLNILVITLYKDFF